MIITEALKASKALIANPINWTQGACARDASNESVAFSDPRATCFCSYGAILYVYGDIAIFKEAKSIRDIIDKVFGHPACMTHYNDSHTHAEVMAKWDEMISIAEKEGV